MRTIIIGIVAGLLALGLFVFVMVPGRHQQFLKNKADFVHTSRFWIILMLLLAPFYIFVCSRPTWYCDYDYFLLPWVNHIREHGGWLSLANSYSNYAPPYLYILTLISYLPGEPLLPIRIVSILFSILGGFFIGKIILLKQKGSWVIPCALFTSLALPTAWLNGAYWGQCDSVFTSFIIISIYFLLVKRQGLAWLWLGVAFSFKLQTVFIFPLYVLLWMRCDCKWWMPFVSLFSTAVMWMPAWLVGRPLGELLEVYWGQISETGSVAITLPNIWCLFPEGMVYQSWQAVFALTVIAILGLWIFFRTIKKVWTRGFIIVLAMLLAAAVPLLLPKMTERYAYIADIVMIAYICYNPKMWLPAVGIETVSLSAYMYALSLCSKGRYFTMNQSDMWPFAVIYLLCVGFIFYDLAKRWIPMLKKQDSEDDEDSEGW